MKKRHLIYFIFQWGVSVFLLGALYYFLTASKMGSFGLRETLFFTGIVVLTFFLYGQSNIYLQKYKFEFLLQLLAQWTLSFAVCIAAIFFLKISHYFSRFALAQFYLLGFVCQIISYLLVKKIWGAYFFKDKPGRLALVFGCDNFTVDTIAVIERKRHQIVIGFIEQCGNQFWIHAPKLGIIDKQRLSSDLLEQLGVEAIYFLSHTKAFSSVRKFFREMSEFPVSLIWYVQLDDFDSCDDKSLDALEEFPFIGLSVTPNVASPFFPFFKRIMDVVISVLLLIFLSPLLIVVALLIKFGSKGPVLFKQNRHGLHGEVISVLKFRSMYVHEADHLRQAVPGDLRITKIGSILRKTSIDELPQLWNVVQGSLSLVGPRPHPVEFNEYYGSAINAYMARHRIKPGITGLAQINGARGQTETIDKMLRRIQYDLEYIRTQSFILDLRILFLTPFALLIYRGQ